MTSPSARRGQRPPPDRLPALLLSLALAACSSGESSSPVSPTSTPDPFAAGALQPGTSQPESAPLASSATTRATVALSDGTALTVPASSLPITFTLARATNSLASPTSAAELTGSMRVVTIAAATSTLPAGARLSLTIPAREYGNVNPDTVNVVRVGDLLIDGKVVRGVETNLPATLGPAGELQVNDPWLADTFAAAAAAPGSSKAAAATPAPATIRYGVRTFQSSLNWKRAPALIRMVPETSAYSPGHRSPLSTYPPDAQARELARCSQNVVVLVHGHNEAEQGGYEASETLAPWLYAAKRDTWTFLYGELLASIAPELVAARDCTVFYEYVYPTYRPVFVGAGNLGDDLAARLTAELQPLLAQKVKPNLFLVAHSMGGLVSRAAIRRFGPDLQTAFQRLVTWGSPHHGSVISAFRFAFAGPYTSVPDSSGLGTYVANIGLLKDYLVSQQLDTPGARDLRWDGVRPLSLARYFAIPADAPEVNTALWALDSGKMLYSTGLKDLAANDPYRSGEPRNAWGAQRYLFLYGATTKAFSLSSPIGMGSFITRTGLANPTEQYLGQILGANDGAGPVISMVPEGIAGDVVAMGDVDHEEYYGAPRYGTATQPDKAIATARATLTALALGDAAYKCVPVLQAIAPTSGPVGTAITLTGLGFGTSKDASVVAFGGVAAAASAWSATSAVAQVPAGAATGDVTITVKGARSAGLRFTVTGITVVLSPSSATLPAGGARTFTASVSGTADQVVTWSVVEGSAGGSITAAGVYTAPATPGTYHVVAASRVDGTKSAPATITVTSAGVSVTVLPTPVQLSPGGTQTFTASVTGTANGAVSWSVQEGAAGGSVTPAGVYTAPLSTGTFHVVATSQADPSKSAAAEVRVVPPVVLTLSPTSAALLAGATKNFYATVTGASDLNVVWSVQEGAAGGAISAGGTYTAPTSSGTFHVVATSVAAPDQSAVATVTVTAAPTTINLSISSLTYYLAFVNVSDPTDTKGYWNIPPGCTGSGVLSGNTATGPTTNSGSTGTFSLTLSPDRTQIVSASCTFSGTTYYGHAFSGVYTVVNIPFFEVYGQYATSHQDRYKYDGADRCSHITAWSFDGQDLNVYGAGYSLVSQTCTKPGGPTSGNPTVVQVDVTFSN